MVNTKFLDSAGLSYFYGLLGDVFVKNSDMVAYSPKITIMSYGEANAWNKFIDAYSNNSIIYCRASSNNNPATGTQGRMAFMAYVNNADVNSITEVEFQYYRSVATHSDATQGDEVYIYKLNKTSGWSVTKRNAYSRVIVGDGLSSSYSNGAITIDSTFNTDNPGLAAIEALSGTGLLRKLSNGWSFDDTDYEKDPLILEIIYDDDAEEWVFSNPIGYQLMCEAHDNDKPIYIDLWENDNSFYRYSLVQVYDGRDIDEELYFRFSYLDTEELHLSTFWISPDYIELYDSYLYSYFVKTPSRNITIANGDKLVVTDASHDNTVERSNISFDGSTTTKALTPKGTWEDFVPTNILSANDSFAIVTDDISSDHILISTIGDGINCIMGDRDSKKYAIGSANANGLEDYVLATTAFVQVELDNYKLEKDYSKEYLTFVALESGTITFTLFSWADTSYVETIAYSKNDGEWVETQNSYNREDDIVISINVVEGDTIRWKGIANHIGDGGDNGGVFTSTCRFNAQGNIMSLLYGDNFQDELTIENKYAFSYLFGDINYGATCYIVDASNLILPATTLANGCYSWMFYYCISLTTAPQLPATTLAQDCYAHMFTSCASLTSAPELSALTLADECYQYMFQGCTALNNITCLATDISASNCTNDWVDGVAATGTFIKADSMSSWTTGNNGIPSGWTVVKQSDYVDVKKYQADTTYAPLASPALTGNPTAPTQTSGDSSTKIATTAFVQGEISSQLGNIETLLAAI